MKLKTGDKVTVIAGANKGNEGKILKVLGDKVLVEGVNIVHKHSKPSMQNQQAPTNTAAQQAAAQAAAAQQAAARVNPPPAIQ